jgi:hypothetical protein
MWWQARAPPREPGVVEYVFSVTVIALVYLCLLIVVFSPSLYAGWIYLVSRKLAVKRKGLLKIAVSTFCINAIIAYFLIHLAFNHFLHSEVAEMEAQAAATLRNAIASQHKHYASYGRYYPVGPVKGPYQDEHGLNVEKDVILKVEPLWDKTSEKETFQAYAIHYWGRQLLFNTKDGKIERVSPGSELEQRMRSKLIQSVR